MNIYKIANLYIETNIDLEPLVPIKSEEEFKPSFSIKLKLESVPNKVLRILGKLSEQPIDGQPYSISENNGSLYLSMTDAFAYINSELITVWPRENNNSAILPIKVSIFDELVPLLCLFKGDLPLHGAAFEKNGEGVLILGRSGSGKSTLATKLAIETQRFISDDVCILSQINDKFYIQGTNPLIKLGKQADYIIPGHRGTIIREGAGKKWYNVNDFSNFVNKPVELSEIYFLRDEDDNLMNNSWYKWRILTDYLVSGRALPISEWGDISNKISTVSSKYKFNLLEYHHHWDNLEKITNKLIGG